MRDNDHPYEPIWRHQLASVDPLQPPLPTTYAASAPRGGEDSPPQIDDTLVLPADSPAPGDRTATGAGCRRWQRAAWLCQFLWELFHGGFGSHSAGFSVINNGEF